MTEATPLFTLDENTFILNGRARRSLKLTSPSEEQSPAEEVEPEKLPGESPGQHRPWSPDVLPNSLKYWRGSGVGLWAFIILAATVAVPIGIGAIGTVIKAKPTRAIATLDMALASPPFPVASTPAEPGPPGPTGPPGDPLVSSTAPPLIPVAAAAAEPERSPDIIDELNRFIDVVKPPAAPPPNVLDDLRRFANTVTLPPAPPRHREIKRSRAERIIPHHFVASKPEEPQMLPAAPIGCPPSVCFPPQSGQTSLLVQRPSAVDLDEAGQPVRTWSRR